MTSDLATISLERRNGPLGLLRGALRVTLLSPLHVLRGRRAFCLGILALIPPLLVLVLRLFGQSDALGITVFKEMLCDFYLLAIFPLIVLFLGAAAIGDDVDDGTVLYLRLRPVPRAAIVIGRFLATVLSAFALLAPSLVLLYLIQIGGVGAEFIPKYARILGGALFGAALAAVGYGALFLLLGLLVRRAVVYGIIFVLLQGFLMAVPGPVAWLSLNLHFATVFSEFGAANGDMLSRLAALEDVGAAPTLQQSLAAVFGGAAVLLTLASWLFASREYLEKPGE